MKNKIQKIEEKITKLKEKKQKLTIRTAEDLFMKLEKMIDSDYLPQMVLGIVEGAIKNSSQKQREEWIKSGSTFWSNKKQQNKAKNSSD